jgi:hypothetical protein
MLLRKQALTSALNTASKSAAPNAFAVFISCDSTRRVARRARPSLRR